MTVIGPRLHRAVCEYAGCGNAGLPRAPIPCDHHHLYVDIVTLCNVERGYDEFFTFRLVVTKWMSLGTCDTGGGSFALRSAPR